MAPRTTTRKKFKDTSANRKKRWNKKSPMARYGKANGSWKGGTSAHYYRRKANAGKGEVVHHKNKGKHTAKNARRSNLQNTTSYILRKVEKQPQQGGNVPRKSKDPRVGTGKKPKGSGRRLYTDENPKDTVGIKFATIKDAKATVAKVKRLRKPYARKIQILTVGEQRAKVMKKKGVVAVFKAGKAALRKANKRKKK